VNRRTYLLNIRRARRKYKIKIKIKLIEEFAANYETMSDDVAKNLLDDSLSIDSDHQKLRQSYLSKICGVLPDKKVARYYQLESKIDAVLEYEMAKIIPLVQ
jgi:hypothetical protein